MPFDGSTFQTASAAGKATPVSAPGFATAFARARYRLARLLRIPDREARPAAPLEIAAILWEARSLIDSEKTWLRGCYHRYPGRFCAIGALRRAGRRASPGVMAQAHGLLLDVARNRGFQSVERMNDQSAHTAVLAAFDAAIADALK